MDSLCKGEKNCVNVKHILVDVEDITVSTVVMNNLLEVQRDGSGPPVMVGAEEGQTEEEASDKNEETEEASGETDGMHLCYTLYYL